MKEIIAEYEAQTSTNSSEADTAEKALVFWSLKSEMPLQEPIGLSKHPENRDELLHNHLPAPLHS